MKKRTCNVCISMVLLFLLVFGTLTGYAAEESELEVLFNRLDAAEKQDLRKISSEMLSDFFDNPVEFVNAMAKKTKLERDTILFNLFYQSQLEDREEALHKVIQEQLPEELRETYIPTFIHFSTFLPFFDVQDDAWYAGGVRYVYGKGIMYGTDSAAFSPDTKLTRGMLVTILYRMSGSEAVEGDSDFTDVTSDAWYAPAVSWAVKKGIVFGFDDQTFRPDDRTTREQMATLLYRYDQIFGTQPDVDYSTMTLDSLFDRVEQTDGHAAEMLFHEILHRFIDDAPSFVEILFSRDPALQNGIKYNILAQVQLEAEEANYENALNQLSEEQKEQMIAFYIDPPSQNELRPARPAAMWQYKDVDEIGDWAKASVIWAVQHQLLQGYNQNISPKGDTTRAQMAVVLTRYLDESIETGVRD